MGILVLLQVEHFGCSDLYSDMFIIIPSMLVPLGGVVCPSFRGYISNIYIVDVFLVVCSHYISSYDGHHL